MNTQCNLFKKTVPGWWRSAQLPSHLFEGWRTIVTGDVIYSPGRSLGFIRSSSIDIVSTSNTQQKNFYSINVYEILSSGKVAPNINFATCAGAWSIRGYFRQRGTANNCVSNRGTLKCMFVQFLKLAWLFAAVFAVTVSRSGIEVTVGTQCVNSVKF